MKKVIFNLIWALSITSICFTLGLVGMDMTIAQRDYEHAVRNGDYEQQITGCIFDRVCDHYTEMLWSK